MKKHEKIEPARTESPWTDGVDWEQPIIPQEANGWRIGSRVVDDQSDIEERPTFLNISWQQAMFWRKDRNELVGNFPTKGMKYFKDMNLMTC
jgi:hypothetical protein